MNQAFVLSNLVSESKTSVPQETFFQFIWRNKINRRYLLIALVGTIIQFVIFKLLYPFADFFSDSTSYIFAAQANLDINIWPIGYSKFLRIFHFISYSDTALVAFQYFFLEIASLYLFYTILYFIGLHRISRTVLFIFLFFNPLFLYLSNYVNSDPLFAGFSLVWFSELLWIIYKPAAYQVFTQAILLFLCFTIRNNAYYYPLIAIVAFLLSNQKIRIKILGIILPFLLIIPFVIHTRNEAYKLTGTKQFSLFTGWQLANNALYMFEYTDSAEGLSPQCQELDRDVRKFYNTTAPEFHASLYNYVGNFFIRDPYSPLRKYVYKHFNITKINTDSVVLVAWAKSSVVFKEYGEHLIKRNIQGYMWGYLKLNAENYFLPPLEKLEIYNTGSSHVYQIIKNWFHYKSDRVTSVSNKLQGNILFLYPTLFLVLNFCFSAILLACWLQGRYKLIAPALKKSLSVVVLLLVVNAIFCISATIIVFRYEFFPLILFFAFTLTGLELLSEKSVTDIKGNAEIDNKNYPRQELASVSH